MLGCDEGLTISASLPVMLECMTNGTDAYWSVEPLQCVSGK